MSDSTDFLIDRTSPLPLWAQVLGDLRTRVAAGEFVERFATDQELQRDYGVSRQTVREAVRRLVDDGVLERQRGRGSVVRDLRQLRGGIDSLFEQLEAAGVAQRSVVRVATVTRDAAVARRLGLAPRSPLVHIERLRLADDAPLALDRTWLVEDAGRPLLSVDLEHTGLYIELERHAGVRVDGGREEIRPVVPSGAGRRLLGMPAGAAFAVERLSRVGSRPVEWRHSLVRGDEYAIAVELVAARG